MAESCWLAATIPETSERRNANIFDPVTANMVGAAEHGVSTLVSHIDDDARWSRARHVRGSEVLYVSRRRARNLRSEHEQFTSLPSARLGVPYYPFMYVLPDGKVLDAGANENAGEPRTLDPATRTWTMVDPVIRDGHSWAMYRPGKIFKIGDATDSGTAGSAAATAYVLDMTLPTPRGGRWPRWRIGEPSTIRRFCPTATC